MNSIDAIIDLSKKTKGSPIFLGDFDKVLRVDDISSRAAVRLKEDSEGNTWFAKEVKYDGDAVKFSGIPEHAKRMFQLNIGYQTVMDSGAANGYLDTVRPLVTDRIWRMLYTRIGMEETIHSESYSYGLNQIFNEKAEEFLDIIYTDPFILKRMNSEIDAFGEVEKLRHSDIDKNSDVMKKAILRMLLAAYLLEGIKFPFSFFVSFTINKAYNSCIQGITRLLRLIGHDEFTIHVPTNLHALKLLRTDPSQGFSHLFDDGWFDQEATKMATMIATQEIEWMYYLLRDGDIPGFNAKIGEHFIKYWTNFRLVGIKVEEIFSGIVINDIITWYNNYRDISKQNAALQEADNLGYVKGGLVNDLNDESEWSSGVCGTGE